MRDAYSVSPERNTKSWTGKVYLRVRLEVRETESTQGLGLPIQGTLRIVQATVSRPAGR